SALAARMRVDASTITRNLHPLLAQGWLAQGPGADARSRLIEATEAGRAKRAEGQRAWKQAQLALNARLGPQRVSALHELIADRIGAGRVLFAGVLLVAIGTALVPYMHSTWGLILAIGVLAAGGAGMAGPSVLMAATTRLIAPAHRGMAIGIVNAGGSFGQFV